LPKNARFPLFLSKNPNKPCHTGLVFAKPPHPASTPGGWLNLLKEGKLPCQKKYALTAQKRDRAGKGVARALRRENQVPAVVYGDNKAPVMISMSSKDLHLEYMKGHMGTNLCELTVDGEKVLTLARDIQTHPVSDKIEHVDFMRVGPKTKIAVEVPLVFLNQDKCPGIKNKGILNVVHHEIELKCGATDIPEHLEVDLSNAEIGDSIKVSMIALPKGAAPANAREGDFTIATIMEPIVQAAEPTPAPVAAPAAEKAPVKKDSDKKAQGMKK
jgi:large subunit ribosomal protein L25